MFSFNLPEFHTLHIFFRFCFSTAYLQHAVHCTLLPLPLRFTICPVYLVTSTMRSYLQDTHSCCSQPPWGQNQPSVSKWAIALIFLFFFLIYSLCCCLMKDEVLNTSAITSLWGRHSSICDPSWCNWILHTECNMEHDLGVPLLLSFRYVFSFKPLKGLCCRPFGKLLRVLGTDVLNDDKWQTID